MTLNAKLDYKRIFAEKHNVEAFIAYEQMEYEDNFLLAGRLGYDSPLIDQIFAGSPDRANWNTDGSASESARQNFIGRVSYDFSKKYLLGFNFRYDGSPIFRNLKLRASWGQLGNDRVDPFQYIGKFKYADGVAPDDGSDLGWVVNGNEIRGIKASSIPNPNITWEVTETTDLGLEAGFLNNKLTFELDVYKSSTSNILGQRQASIPGYTGLSLPDENIGKMESKGIGYTEHRQI